MLFHRRNRMEDDAVKLSRATTLTIGASLILGASWLITPIARGAQPTCSVEKLQGRYVFTGQGIKLNYGAFDFEGTGNFLGKQTSQRHKPQRQREDLSG